MARNPVGVVRQLIGNRNKLCSSYHLHLHHHHQLHSFPIKAASAPPSSPITSPSTPISNGFRFSYPPFLQHRFLSSPSVPSNIVDIKSEEGFKSAVKKVQDESLPAIFYFTAAWCGPCKLISPVIGKLSEKYPHVTTYKIDIDEEDLGKTLSEVNITSVPTFHFFKNGKMAAEFIGADGELLKKTTRKLYK